MIQLTAVVMPCLNEQSIMAQSCASLGFGVELSPPKNAILVIVDNGSSDATPNIALTIKAQSPPDSVIVISEPEQGYIPARHRGALAVEGVGLERGIPSPDILLLQVDADTQYGENYITEITEAAARSTAACFFRARTAYPPEFSAMYSAYLDLCNLVDAEFEYLLSDHPDDVMIDDKACAFRLSDYFAWGGHLREFDANGDEILSETTRLFLRAKAGGCDAQLIEGGLAEHSIRRVLQHPAMDFATAGFPRQRTWRQSWEENSKPINSIEMFAIGVNHALLEDAKRWRRIHLLGLFGILPLHVARTLGIESTLEAENWAANCSLPHRQRNDVTNRPGVLLQDALEAAEKLRAQ